MSRVLVISDLHLPACRKHALRFCQDVYEEWDCDKVMFIGDIADFHAISFHAKHPELPGPKDEYELAHNCIQEWYKVFPKADVCIGNHDERVRRLAESVSIPAKFLKDFSDMWDTPKWNWNYDHVIDDVFYSHGIGAGGDYPATNTMRKMSMSVVHGHIHHAFGINWQASRKARLFGMSCGCLIDDRFMNFAYSKHTQRRSMLGVGIVIDGIPYLEIMKVGVKEKYHDSRR